MAFKDINETWTRCKRCNMVIRNRDGSKKAHNHLHHRRGKKGGNA